MESEKQTAVEWLEVEFNKYYAFSREEMQTFNRIFNQSKQLEKEQVESAYNQGRKDGHSIGLFYDEPELATNDFENSEQYYNEKYDKKK